MQLSELWLREMVNPAVNATELAEALTMQGLEVDAITRVAEDFSGVLVAEVLSCEQHPNADRLRVCQLNAGDAAPINVVCGASNVRSGLKVALVRVGGVLPGNIKITPAKLRGVESFGMICSARELGLEETNDGIIELPATAPVGMSLREYLMLDDNVLHIDLTPNRGDCASVLGVARELSAKFNIPLQMPVNRAIEAVHQTTFPVKNQVAEQCPRYVSRVIQHINPEAQTPPWMQERLRRSGLRCVCPAVDITNYVMLELGQPLHAFDLDKLSSHLEVRLSHKNEKITLLDNQTLALPEGLLLIADAQQPQALAGVMGASGSAVDQNSTNLLIESAYFQATAVCQTVRRLGIHSDASYRFERGVDPGLQRRAMERFTELLVEICGGEPGLVVEHEASAHLPVQQTILLRHGQIERVLGISIPAMQVQTILQALGMSVTAHAKGFEVVAPSYRSDIQLEVDLIEEVLRLYGIGLLPQTPMYGELRMEHKTPSHVALTRWRHLMVDLGYCEAVTYSFVDPKHQRHFGAQHDDLVLANPLAEDLSAMRTSLWPGLVQALQYNLNRQQSAVRLFEVGLSFIKDHGSLIQDLTLAGLIAGAAHPLHWGVEQRAVDFFDIKGHVERILNEVVDIEKVEWRRSTHPALHPGQSSDIFLDNVCIGRVGALHPVLVAEFDFNRCPLLFELNLNKMSRRCLAKYKIISKFPAVRRDLAIVVDSNVTADDIQQVVKEHSGHLLLEFKIFDIYQGEGIEDGKKSVALELSLQDPSRTLVDEDVNEIIRRVVEALQHKLKAILRA